jgi:hypothetical protein
LLVGCWARAREIRDASAAPAAREAVAVRISRRVIGVVIVFVMMKGLSCFVILGDGENSFLSLELFVPLGLVGSYAGGSFPMLKVLALPVVVRECLLRVMGEHCCFADSVHG